MSFCRNCGSKIEEGEQFCSSCGTKVELDSSVQTTKESGTRHQSFHEYHTTGNTYDESEGCSEQEIQSGKIMGVLAYFSVLVIIPLFIEKTNRFVRFHVKQGITLLAAEAIIWIAGIILPAIGNVFPTFMILLGLVLGVFKLILSVLSIIGIVNVVKGSRKPIPIIGRIQILK